MIEIPKFKKLNLTDIVCDYNGTIAKDGTVIPQIKSLIKKLSKEYSVHVITADTFGSVKKQLEKDNVNIKILSSNNHTKEKAKFIKKLGYKNCVAIGNGNNDAKMLQKAKLGIAILGDEGCSKDTLLSADIVCKSSTEALSLFLNSNRLIATLRR